MTEYVARSRLQVADGLAALIEDRMLPGTAISAERFWQAVADIFDLFNDENRSLLARRDELQSQIDAWHREHATAFDPEAYRKFLEDIGYLAPDPEPFTIDPEHLDQEFTVMGGPQLVVPVTNARFALNAANARWGSLYDALYSTDALPGALRPDGYDAERGERVIVRSNEFLDSAVPLASGLHAEVRGWHVEEGLLHPRLRDEGAFVGYKGDPRAPSAVLLRHNGLHIELVFDRESAVGRSDPSGRSDVVVEAAITTIVDLEDSVSTVDAEDKVAAYANWLGLIAGDLEVSFTKNGRTMTRRLAADREYLSPQGGGFTLPGRSLLLVRNVGLLMTSDAVLLPDGSEAPEGILDAIVTTLAGMRDVKHLGTHVNSPAGSIYIVKPKLHGPDEAAFVDRLFSAIEDRLGLPANTVKIGLMDEERRTSCNLAASIHALRHRIMFTNTGFLDRTGDEIHTSMQAGAVLPKGEMRDSAWQTAYEKRNVGTALTAGFSGRAQIGKGMWAAPDRMADMVTQKIGHLRAGATVAWVPSPTAATLHALHYHQVDVFGTHAKIAAQPFPSLSELLSLPLAGGRNWSPDNVRREVDNNAQSILGYVVRWIDQGVGCSKVPDIDDVGLMEDRATLRISAQQLANWAMHDVCSQADVEDALLRMAAVVDAQNADDPAYTPMAGDPHGSLAFQAARALILEGSAQPNGYTEPVLHRFRRLKKAQTRSSPLQLSPTAAPAG